VSSSEDCFHAASAVPVTTTAPRSAKDPNCVRRTINKDAPVVLSIRFSVGRYVNDGSRFDQSVGAKVIHAAREGIGNHFHYFALAACGNGLKPPPSALYIDKSAVAV